MSQSYRPTLFPGESIADIPNPCNPRKALKIANPSNQIPGAGRNTGTIRRSAACDSVAAAVTVARDISQPDRFESGYENRGYGNRIARTCPTVGIDYCGIPSVQAAHEDGDIRI